MKAKLKLILLAVVVVYVIVVAVLNRHSVPTHLWFVELSMPRALLMLVMAGVGFVVGLFTAGKLSKKGATKK